MALETFNEEVAKSGGQWVKLEKKGDHFKGRLIDIEIRDRTTPQGDVVLSRKTQKPRKVFIVTYAVTPETDEDNGIRHYQANESAQSAIREVVTEVGGFKAGGTITLGVKADRADEYSQHEYLCRYEPPTAADEAFVAGLTAKTVTVDNEEEPF